MGAWQRILTAASAACALFCALLALPMHAIASDTESSIMFDDDQLIYVSPQHAIGELQQMRNLGVDQIKVSVYWGLVAPSPNSSRRPNFNAADPNAYPSGAWTRYDTIDREATKLGMSVYFMLQGQTPDWARAPGKIQGPPLSIMPKSASGSSSSKPSASATAGRSSRAESDTSSTRIPSRFSGSRSPSRPRVPARPRAPPARFRA